MKKFFLNGDKYEGGLEGDEPHGKGELTTSSGDKYIGDFQNGKKHGEGLLIKNNGNKYEGSFKNSKAHGLGKSINISGDKYEGDFIDGKRHGQGVFIDRDGNKYEGEFKDGKYDGYGVNVYKSGNKYEGEYKDDLMHGEGTYSFSNGDIYIGEFRNGIRNGHGKHQFPNGDSTSGEFQNGYINGLAIFTRANGEVYKGFFKDGVQQVDKNDSNEIKVVNDGSKSKKNESSKSHLISLDELLNNDFNRKQLSKIRINVSPIPETAYLGESFYSTTHYIQKIKLQNKEIFYLRDVNNKYFIKKIFIKEDVFKSSGLEDVQYTEYYAHVNKDIITVGVFAHKILDLYLNILEKIYNWNDLDIEAQHFILSSEAIPLKETSNHFEKLERDEAKKESEKIDLKKSVDAIIKAEKLREKKIKFETEEKLKKELNTKLHSKKKNKEKNSNSEIVKYWQKLLIKNNNPYISGDFKNLKVYQNFITSLSPLQKGEDLGICTYIMFNYQGSIQGVDTFIETSEISGEVNDRGVCHVGVLSHTLKLQLYKNITEQDIIPLLIKGSEEIMTKWNKENEKIDFNAIGIKMVDWIGDKILD
jgi:hypothetical protein